ncbi:hypothetical protein acdb102_14050 [Acidothermaceae bacterium B102]|nr:hypothetical protein acdb102_14050 [Acidothermaceae bacterium B102]
MTVGSRRRAHPEGPGQPAASLIARRRALTASQRRARRPWWRGADGWTLRTAPLLWPLLLTWALTSGDQLAWAFFAFHTLLLCSTLGNRCEERRSDPALAALGRAIKDELRAADQLHRVEREGWVVLHDRTLPRTGHRLAHLAVGPPGVLIIAPAPLAADGPWLAGCRDDAEAMRATLRADLGRGVLTVTTLVVSGNGAPVSGLPTCAIGSLAARLRSLPPGLPVQAEAYVAGIIDERCPRVPLDPTGERPELAAPTR